jgi:hypothetical protein
MRKFSRVLLAMPIALFSLSVQPVTTSGGSVEWVNWTSATSGSTGSASGTLGGISVSYSGDVLFAQTNGLGTDYWLPSSPFLSATVPDGPPNADIVALTGGNSAVDTISFSRSVTNPILAINSLGEPGYGAKLVFNGASPVILSYGDGYWGWSGFGSLQTSGNTLIGYEGTGTIQLYGTFTSISWVAPIYEDWYGFTVGISSVPEPSSLVSAATAFLIGLGVVLRHRRLSFGR